MVSLSRTIRPLVPCAVMLYTLRLDAARFLRYCLRSPAALAAANLCLRKQRALYQARHGAPPTPRTLLWSGCHRGLTGARALPVAGAQCVVQALPCVGGTRPVRAHGVPRPYPRVRCGLRRCGARPDKASGKPFWHAQE